MRRGQDAEAQARAYGYKVEAVRRGLASAMEEFMAAQPQRGWGGD